MKKRTLLTSIAALCGASALQAAIIQLDQTNSPGIVTSEINVGLSTYYVIDAGGGVVTLTNDNEYVLEGVTFVENGVLEIEPGTIIRGQMTDNPDANNVGTLVITRSARINANGNPSEPIIFTTAAVDDGSGNVKGLTITDVNPGTGDYFFIKSADRWTPGDPFLDADPKNSPLAPTKGFDSTTAGDQPSTFVRDGNGNPLTFIETDQEHRSLWGGVIILGSSTTSIGTIDANGNAAGTVKGDLGGFLDRVFEGFVEGLNILEVGERGVYGGNNPNDSSGIFRYASIRHGGANIGEANEINGLTMGAVGRGTLIEYVEVYCNGDDAYEWFGGSVDGKYLIALYNNDDSFDIDEGFTGRGQFWFSLMLDDQINGNHGGEHDGTDALYDSIEVDDTGFASNDDAMGLVPTFVTVYNATYIGGGDFGNRETDSRTNNGLRMRDSFGGIYRNSIISDHRDEVIRLDDDSIGRIFLGDLIMEGNIFYGNAAPVASFADVYRLGATFATDARLTTAQRTDPLDLANTNNTINVDAFAARRNGNALFSIPAKFDRRGLFNGGVGFDPRPDAAASAVTSNLAPIDPTYFTTAGYKGAFAPGASANNIWTGVAGNAQNPAWSVFGARVLDLQ